MNRNTLLVFALAAGFIIYRWIGVKKAAASFKKMPPDTYTLLDVRTPQETAEGMLNNAVNIPLDALPAKIGLIAKNKPVYVYCASGSRSTQAVSFLKTKGYEASNLGSYSSLKE